MKLNIKEGSIIFTKEEYEIFKTNRPVMTSLQDIEDLIKSDPCLKRIETQLAVKK